MSNEMLPGGKWACVPVRVLRDTVIPANAKLLYGELDALSCSAGYCWATNQYLAEMFGWSVKSVSRLISTLEESGYIRSEMVATSSGRERRIYTIPTDYRPHGGIDSFVHTPPQNCPGGVDKTVQALTNKRKQIENTPIPPTKRLMEFAGDDEALRDALAAFSDVRAKKKKPLNTERQVTLLLNRLDKLSGGDRDLMIALLDNAVLHSWESIYPLKPDELPTSKQTKAKASDYEVLKEWT